jgi:hypothetical protein
MVGPVLAGEAVVVRLAVQTVVPVAAEMMSLPLYPVRVSLSPPPEDKRAQPKEKYGCRAMFRDTAMERDVQYMALCCPRSEG